MSESASARVGGYTYEQIAAAIDHSLLRPELTAAEVVAGCELARAYAVASVCARPYDVPTAARVLAGSGVRVGTVIGFPHGAHTTATKVFEARDALAGGAVELDMVVNIGQLRSGNVEAVRDDVAAVVAAAGDRAIVKVILENAYLSDEQKIVACRLVAAAGGHFVKTSTGFAPSGATLEDLALMRANAPARVQVKAAGGVRTLDALIAVLDVGVTRVGATATKAILDDFRARGAAGTGAGDEANLTDGY